MKLGTICALILLSAGFISDLDAKRHSYVNKVERYEKRAQASAQAHSPLSKALSKQTKHMSYDEALLAQDYYRTAQQPDMVIKAGERILAVGGNQTIHGVQEVLRKTRLEVAQLSLDQKKYADAERHAQDYLMFYPGSADSKKASFISLSAAYRSQLHSQRDQQKTNTTIEQARAFLEKYPQDHEFRPHVEHILHQSYIKLIRSELHIIQTQINSARYNSSPASLLAADKRLTALKEKLLPHAPDTRKRVLETELLIAQIKGDTDRTQRIQQEIGALPKQSTDQQNGISTWQSVKNYFSEDNEGFFKS